MYIFEGDGLVDCAENLVSIINLMAVEWKGIRGGTYLSSTTSTWILLLCSGVRPVFAALSILPCREDDCKGGGVELITLLDIC